MYELFKTVLMLSVFGFGISAVLLCLKPITSKKFSAKWQYYVWIAVLLSMVVPIYKLIPEKEVQKIGLVSRVEMALPREEEVNDEPAGGPQMTVPGDLPLEGAEDAQDGNAKESYTAPAGGAAEKPQNGVDIWRIISYIWFAGMCIYLLAVASSYIAFIIRRRKKSVCLEDNAVFAEVKKELNIKRKIKVKMTQECSTPMLAGVIFPAVYLPCRQISDENLRMVFLHELTHYKRKDLIVKWFAVFVNALHWFNPLVYLLCANISEACEVSCDMEVTKNMSAEEQKFYMKTILDVAGLKEANQNVR